MNISKINTNDHSITQFTLLIGLFFISSLVVHADEMTVLLPLDVAIEQAQKNDPWLVENRFKQDALASKSVAASTLPDPIMTLGLLNMPTDGFDVNQEGMTQFKVGISQMFPRGDSLSLQKQKLLLLSGQNPYLREDRKAQIAVIVTSLWLDAFNARESIRLIEKDRELFEQLVDISEASYSTAFGGTQQQDVIRAQLELTRLEDRLTKLKQQQEVSQKKLSQWVSGQFVEYFAEIDTVQNVSLATLDSNNDHYLLPQLVLNHSELLHIPDSILPEKLTSYLIRHPLVLALDNRIKASDTEIELTKQQYKSQWGINAGYGYRADDLSGRSRADLFSLGVSFDLPLFTENRQDKQVQAAVSGAEAVKTQKWLLLRKMISEFDAAKVQLQRLEQRYELYQQQLLPQIHEQADAALTAYTNDEGDFAEVIRARIDVLNAEIDNLGIDVERQKNISQLNYYLIADDENHVSAVKGNQE
jgi:outer membrane protein TolC